MDGDTLAFKPIYTGSTSNCCVDKYIRIH